MLLLFIVGCPTLKKKIASKESDLGLHFTMIWPSQAPMTNLTTRRGARLHARSNHGTDDCLFCAENMVEYFRICFQSECDGWQYPSCATTTDTYDKLTDVYIKLFYRIQPTCNHFNRGIL